MTAPPTLCPLRMVALVLILFLAMGPLTTALTEPVQKWVDPTDPSTGVDVEQFHQFQDQFVGLLLAINADTDCPNLQCTFSSDAAAFGDLVKYQFIEVEIEGDDVILVDHSPRYISVDIASSEGTITLPSAPRGSVTYYGIVRLNGKHDPPLPTLPALIGIPAYDSSTTHFSLQFTFDQNLSSQLIPGRYTFGTPEWANTLPMNVNFYPFFSPYLSSKDVISLSCFDVNEGVQKVVARLTAPDEILRTESYLSDTLYVDVFAATSQVHCNFPVFLNHIPTINMATGSMAQDVSNAAIAYPQLQPSSTSANPHTVSSLPYLPTNWVTQNIDNDPADYETVFHTKPVIHLDLFGLTPYEPRYYVPGGRTLTVDDTEAPTKHSVKLGTQVIIKRACSQEDCGYTLTSDGFKTIVPSSHPSTPMKPEDSITFTHQVGGRTLSHRWFPSYLHFKDVQSISIDTRTPGVVSIETVVQLENFEGAFHLLKGEGVALSMRAFGILDLDISWGNHPVQCDVQFSGAAEDYHSLQSVTTIVDDTVFIYFFEDYLDLPLTGAPELLLQCYFRTLPSLAQNFYQLLQLSSLSTTSPGVTHATIGSVTPVHRIMGVQGVNSVPIVTSAVNWRGAGPVAFVLDEPSTSPSHDELLISQVTVVGCIALLKFPTTTPIALSTKALQTAAIDSILSLLKQNIWGNLLTDSTVVFPLENSVSMDETIFAGPWLFGAGPALAEKLKHSPGLNRQVFHEYSALIQAPAACPTQTQLDSVLGRQRVTIVELETDKFGTTGFDLDLTTFLRCSNQNAIACQTIPSDGGFTIHPLPPRYLGKFPLAKKPFGADCSSHSECIFTCALPLDPASPRPNIKVCSNNPNFHNREFGSGYLATPSTALFSATARQSATFLPNVGLTTGDLDEFKRQCHIFPTDGCCAALSPNAPTSCGCLDSTSAATLDNALSCVYGVPQSQLFLTGHWDSVLTNIGFKFDPVVHCNYQLPPDALGSISSAGVLRPAHHSLDLAQQCHAAGFVTPSSLLAVSLNPSSTRPSAAISPNLYIETARELVPATYPWVPRLKPTAFPPDPIAFTAGSTIVLRWSPLDLVDTVPDSCNLDFYLHGWAYVRGRLLLGSTKLEFAPLTSSASGYVSIPLAPAPSSFASAFLGLRCQGQTVNRELLAQTPVLSNTKAGYNIKFDNGDEVPPPSCDAAKGLTLSRSTNECACMNMNYVFNSEYGLCAPPCQCENGGKCKYFKNAPKSAEFADVNAPGDINFFNYQCICQPGWYHRFCDVPVDCLERKCPLLPDNTADPFAIPVPPVVSGSEKCISSANPQCTCVKGFTMVNGKCTCKKLLEERTSGIKCHPLNSHTVATTAARCLIDAHDADSVLELQRTVENVSDLTPWLRNVPCPCRFKWAGATCDYAATYFTFQLLTPTQESLKDQPDANLFGETPALRVFWYDQTKQLLQSVQESLSVGTSALKMSLYDWNTSTHQITIQLWFEPLSAPMYSTSTHAPQTTFHTANLAHLRLAAQRAAAQLTTAQTSQDDLNNLFDLWDSLNGSGSTPISVVDDKQTSFPSPTQDPRCTYADSTPPPAGVDCTGFTQPTYDAQYAEEMNQDKNQTNFVNELTFDTGMGSSADMTTVIVIAIVVPIGAILIFIITACAIKTCHKNKSCCFATAQKKKDKEKQSKASTSPGISLTSTSSSDQSTGSGTKGSVTTQALPASIMPSHTASAGGENSSLPKDWQEQTDHATGKTYYLNLVTMQSQWEHPGEPKAKASNQW